jgi:hypothetical protein
MRTRKQLHKVNYDAYKKMHDFRAQQIRALDLVKDIFERE